MSKLHSKFTTYLLSAAVVAVWGVIIGKLVQPKDQTKPTKSVIKPAAKDPAPMVLNLTYRDPFFPPPAKSRTATPKPEKKEIRTAPKDDVTFVGRLKCRDKTYYIININSAQHTIERGQAVGGYTLVRIKGDSVYLKNNDQLLTLSIKE